jgi:putative PEP-CTERM system histidine kinase
VQQTAMLWSYALAALLFGGLALARIRAPGSGLLKFTFVIALTVTALWALAVAGIGSRDLVERVAEGLRNIAWLAFMYALERRDRAAMEERARGVTAVYGVAVLLVLVGIGLAIASAAIVDPAAPASADSARLLMHMMVAVSALVLVHHLYGAVAPDARSGIRLVIVALATMWGLDLALYSTAYLTGQWPDWLLITRGLVLVLLAPVFALAVQRNGDWQLQLSRTVAWQTISLAALLLYFGVMVLATSAIAAIGGANVRVAQTAFVFGSTTALLTLLSSPWLKAWAKVQLAKHLFQHRYDYRAEWQRFTDTLGKPGDDALPLDTRIVKAIADLTDSPAGLLLMPDEAGLSVSVSWNWASDEWPGMSGDAALATHLADTARIIELDAIRADRAFADDLSAAPEWMLALPNAWALVPLHHFDRLAGVILLARPPVDRALDWEDFDLLRLAGRQAASYLAEARSQSALADAQRFDEFNRRFAFIMHDIKNLVSQLTLTARNAERHADNPAFRADMIVTLRESAGRMNELLARLSQHHGGESGAIVPVALVALLQRIAARHRAQHPVMTVAPRETFAMADPARLEQVLAHLVQNAIEASPPAEPVTLALSGKDGAATIDVIDRGCGMTPAFVRDQLFKPFVSTKAGGFGIGAFEARQLAAAMGGTVEVTSREGEGTRFRVTLRAAEAPAQTLEAAA